MMEQLLRNNNVAKILAFFLALMLWVYVTSDNLRPDTQDVTRTFSNVPLAWHNLDDSLVLTAIPSEIDVVLRGRADIIEEMTPQDLKVFVDLQGLGDGQHRLTPSSLVPRGTRVLSYRPQQVTVQLEEVVLQQKPVILEINGEPAPGLVMGEPRILPDSVFIRGPRSVLPQVDRVAAVIDVEGATGDRIQMVSVRAVDEAGQEVAGVTVNPTLVEVLVPFAEPHKEVPVRVPLEGKPAEGFQVRQVSVTPGTAVLRGREEVLSNVLEVLTPPVDITDAVSNISLTLDLIVPENLELLSSATVRVEVIFESLL
jgi:YbbR domain-containing protein